MANNRPSFQSLLVVGGMILMLAPALTAAVFYAGALQREAERLVAKSLLARGELGAELLARRLHSAWQQVNRYSEKLSKDEVQFLSRDFTLIADLDDRIEWIGMADLQGNVIAASGGLLEGVKVSERPWFRRGLAGPFAGDVHEAALLSKHLAKKGEVLRFVDFATPVTADGGAVLGVVGAHIRWDWVREQLAGISGEDAELLLVSRNGEVLYGPPGLANKLATRTAVSAGQVRPEARPETWPDGRVYMTAIVPAVSYQDMPSFGWSIIVRQPYDYSLASSRELIRTFWLILGSAGLISTMLLLIAAGWLAKPLKRQSRFALDIVHGRVDQPPYEETRYQEAATLSSALVQLQARLQR